MDVPIKTGSNEIGKLEADDQNFEEFEIAEEELLDAYIYQQLSPDEQSLVEKGLRDSPRLVERLHFASLLAKAAASVPEPEISPSFRQPDSARNEVERTPWWKGLFVGSLVPAPARVAIAACAIFVFVAGAVLFVGWIKLRSESNRLAQERSSLEQQKLELEKRLAEQRLTATQLAAALQQERQEREADRKLIAEFSQGQKQNGQREISSVSTLATMFLLSGRTRADGSDNELPVSQAASTIVLNLSLEANDYLRYLAVVKNDEKTEVFRQSGLKARRSRSGPILSLRIPASRMPPDDYTILVSGLKSRSVVEPAYDYALRIKRKD